MKEDPKNKRGIGDNSDTPEVTFTEYVIDALESAITYITKVAEKNERLSNTLNKAVLGKNNLQRGIALGEAVKVSKSVAKDIAPFKEVLDAVHKGQNIHTGKLKSAKLELCDEVQNFGNFIANSTVGETDENVRIAIDQGKISAKEDLDEPF
jgi:hypothetical protein